MKANYKNRVGVFCLFCLPLLAMYLIFSFTPLIKTFFYSVTDWSGYGDYNFVGFENFLPLIGKAAGHGTECGFDDAHMCISFRCCVCIFEKSMSVCRLQSDIRSYAFDFFPRKAVYTAFGTLICSGR